MDKMNLSDLGGLGGSRVTAGGLSLLLLLLLLLRLLLDF